MGRFAAVATFAALAIVLLLAVESRPAASQEVELTVVDVKAVAKGYAASRLIGDHVANDRQEWIGTIRDIIVSRDGHEVFAVLQVGGFLGFGDHSVAVPFESLRFHNSGGIVLPGASRDALTILPVFKYGS